MRLIFRFKSSVAAAVAAASGFCGCSRISAEYFSAVGSSRRIKSSALLVCQIFVKLTVIQTQNFPTLMCELHAIATGINFVVH